MRLLLTPHPRDRFGLAVNDALAVGLAQRLKLLVEVLERRAAQPRREEVAPGKADAAFNPAFLMPFARGAVTRLKQVVAAKQGERLLLYPTSPGKDLVDGRLEVVVGDRLGDTPKERECPHVGVEERFLLLGRVGAYEHAPGVTQPEGEILDDDDLLGHLDFGLAPVRLGGLPRIKCQGQKALRLSDRVGPLLAHIRPHSALAAPEPLGTDQDVDPMGGEALFARHARAFGQQRVDPRLPRVQRRRRSRPTQVVSRRLGRLNRLPDRAAAAMQFARDLADLLVFGMERVSNSGVVVHCLHLPV